MAIAIDKNGLKVDVGNSFKVRVADSASSTDIVDFTQAGNISLRFPVDLSLKQETEIIEQSLIGIATSLKFLGKTTIQGDVNDIATANGITWYAKNTLGGVHLSRLNNKAMLTIETETGYILSVERDTSLTGQVNKVIISRVGKTDIEIIITAGTTVKQFVDKVNAIDDFSAVLLIGEGTELFNIEAGKDLFTCHILQHFFVGELTEAYKKTIAEFVNIIIPKRGNPNYFNLLVESRRAEAAWQYVGARLLKLGLAFANSALTNVSSSIWASGKAEFAGTPAQATVDDIKAAYSQTNGRTVVYSCGVKANAVASCTNNLELAVEPQWNISNEAYEIPVEKYTDSYDFELMFNKQSAEIFEKRVLANKNISVLIVSETFLNAKKYQLIKYAKTLLGQPQYPAIADGVIQLQASGFTSVANTYDPFTSCMIITSDVSLVVNYTEAQMKQDFPDYID